MIPKVWLINIILALCTLFVGKSAYSVWTRQEQTTQEVRSEIKARSAVEPRQTKRSAPAMEASYEMIADRNLFSVDRAEYLPPEPITEPDQTAPQLPGKQINLYGVIIMKDTQKALIANPDMKPGDPRNKWVSVGDSIGNLTVIAIEPESISLKEGGKKYKIPLYNKKKGYPPSRTSGVDRPTSSATVVNTETPKKTPVKKVAKGETVGKKRTPAADKKIENQEAEENRVIETPFGPIIRRSN